MVIGNIINKVGNSLVGCKKAGLEGINMQIGTNMDCEG
jgi:hypothetical protein